MGRDRPPRGEEGSADPPLHDPLLPRRDGALPLPRPGGHGNPAAPLLPAERRGGVRERAIHHGRGPVRLAHPLDPLVGRQPLRGRRHPAHGLRLLPEGVPRAAGDDLDLGRPAALSRARLRLLRLPAALEHARLLRDEGRHRRAGADPGDRAAAVAHPARRLRRHGRHGLALLRDPRRDPSRDHDAAARRAPRPRPAEGHERAALGRAAGSRGR